MKDHQGDPTGRGSGGIGYVFAERNLLSALSDQDRSRLFSAGRVRIAEAGEDVVRQGTRGDCLFVLTEGELAVVRCLPGDEEQVLATAKPEMVLGEVAALGRGVRSATLRATRHSVLREIGLRAFEAVALYGDGAGQRILRAVAVSLHERLTRTRRTATALKIQPQASPSADLELQWSRPDPEVISVLGLLPDFETMDLRDWEEILPLMSIAHVERGASLVLPEAPDSNEVIILLRGALSPWLGNTSGPDVTMPASGPGCFIEYAKVLGMPSEPHRWRARSASRLLRLDAPLFSPGSAFAAHLLYALSRNLATTLRRSTALSVHFQMAWAHDRANGSN